jgi:hypothetical protein
VTEHCCKVGRVADRYDLPNLDDALARRHGAGDGLRDLASLTNRRILADAITGADADVVGDADALYETITGDDVSAGRRAEVRAQLSNAGVDVLGMEDDFVSHQTIRSHLRECLDVDTSRSSPLDRERAAGTVEWARSRSEAVIQRTVERLRESDELATGPLDVTHTVRITCEDCGRTYRQEELLTEGRCACAGGE